MHDIIDRAQSLLQLPEINAEMKTVRAHQISPKKSAGKENTLLVHETALLEYGQEQKGVLNNKNNNDQNDQRDHELGERLERKKMKDRAQISIRLEQFGMGQKGNKRDDQPNTDDLKKRVKKYSEEKKEETQAVFFPEKDPAAPYQFEH